MSGDNNDVLLMTCINCAVSATFSGKKDLAISFMPSLNFLYRGIPECDFPFMIVTVVR